jgi:type I restriction enzyme M protein
MAEAWVAYVDEIGFCRSATLADVEATGFALSPSRYVGSATVVEADGVVEKRLTEIAGTLAADFEANEKLAAEVSKALKALNQ